MTAKNGIFGRRADEQDQAALDIGQQDVLLGAVEAVDFVEEEDGALAGVGQAVLGGVEDRADFLDADGGGVDLLEVAFGVVRR